MLNKIQEELIPYFKRKYPDNCDPGFWVNMKDKQITFEGSYTFEEIIKIAEVVSKYTTNK